MSISACVPSDSLRFILSNKFAKKVSQIYGTADISGTDDRLFWMRMNRDCLGFGPLGSTFWIYVAASTPGSRLTPKRYGSICRCPPLWILRLLSRLVIRANVHFLCSPLIRAPQTLASTTNPNPSQSAFRSGNGLFVSIYIWPLL